MWLKLSGEPPFLFRAALPTVVGSFIIMYLMIGIDVPFWPYNRWLIGILYIDVVAFWLLKVCKQSGCFVGHEYLSNSLRIIRCMHTGRSGSAFPYFVSPFYQSFIIFPKTSIHRLFLFHNVLVRFSFYDVLCSSKRLPSRRFSGSFELDRLRVWTLARKTEPETNYQG